MEWKILVISVLCSFLGRVFAIIIIAFKLEILHAKRQGFLYLIATQFLKKKMKKFKKNN
jgi:hypothetical protein